ncbi:MAG: diphosphomevalonate decarboxylase, partial [Gammaproteobacteria bacterium]|nr:diphosphomevalonate decarboxylase [Gammaproteobacteria bacterium]
ALVKYWGKRATESNLPAVGSISMTLSELYTSMSVEIDASLMSDVLLINGRDEQDMLPRISRCLDSLCGGDRPRLRINSDCNFPIAAGLASSASSFAALVVAADAALGQRHNQEELARQAGRASGSAARSLLGGFVELQNRDEDIAVSQLLGPTDWPLKVVVAVTSAGPKPISSGAAMEISRETSPFFARWVEQQAADLDAARSAIAARDFAKLGAVAEHNCLKMHSVMWGSRPPIVYWNSGTLACMQTVRELQAEGTAVFFTIDAGPQVKAVCLPGDTARVRQALASTSGVTDVLVSGLGEGARTVMAA